MIERVSLILDVFSPEEPVLTGGEIARRAGLSRATAARILSELAKHDFVDRVQSGYQIGIRCFELGQMAQQPKDLRRLALATMFDLRRATGLTVQLGVLEGNDVVYIEILRGQYRDLTIPPGLVAVYRAMRLPAGRPCLPTLLTSWSRIF